MMQVPGVVRQTAVGKVVNRQSSIVNRQGWLIVQVAAVNRQTADGSVMLTCLVCLENPKSQFLQLTSQLINLSTNQLFRDLAFGDNPAYLCKLLESKPEYKKGNFE